MQVRAPFLELMTSLACSPSGVTAVLRQMEAMSSVPGVLIAQSV